MSTKFTFSIEPGIGAIEKETFNLLGKYHLEYKGEQYLSRELCSRFGYRDHMGYRN